MKLVCQPAACVEVQISLLMQPHTHTARLLLLGGVWVRKRVCVNEMDGMSALWSYLCLHCHWSCLLYIPSISFSRPALSLLSLCSYHHHFTNSSVSLLCICFSLSGPSSSPLCISCSICVCLSGMDQGGAYCCTEKYRKEGRPRVRDSRTEKQKN